MTFVWLLQSKGHTVRRQFEQGRGVPAIWLLKMMLQVKLEV